MFIKRKKPSCNSISFSNSGLFFTLSYYFLQFLQCMIHELNLLVWSSQHYRANLKFDIQGDQLNMTVCFCTVACTGQVTFYKVPEQHGQCNIYFVRFNLQFCDVPLSAQFLQVCWEGGLLSNRHLSKVDTFFMSVMAIWLFKTLFFLPCDPVSMAFFTKFCLTFFYSIFLLGH